jgi:hypothetical protein
VQAKVIAARYTASCFVTGEWVTRGKIVASVAAISLSVCTLGYYQELSYIVSDIM